MKLTVRERLVTLSILPQEGDFLTLKVLRKLRESLGFDESEHKLYKFVQKDGSITWDDKTIQEKEVEIGEKAQEIISNSLKELNREKKLKDEHFDIYAKFVEVS